jgi:hypothetical protein
MGEIYLRFSNGCSLLTDFSFVEVDRFDAQYVHKAHYYGVHRKVENRTWDVL